MRPGSGEEITPGDDTDDPVGIDNGKPLDVVIEHPAHGFPDVIVGVGDDESSAHQLTGVDLHELVEPLRTPVHDLDDDLEAAAPVDAERGVAEKVCLGDDPYQTAVIAKHGQAAHPGGDHPLGHLGP
jgi:hypothetical protein